MIVMLNKANKINPLSGIYFTTFYSLSDSNFFLYSSAFCFSPFTS